ncbi:prepilin-type N-terminal cleavage/methylation domain-containing protein [Cellulomonas pakistanensis]|uniref:Ig-like domain-containing protein n=1 Tax=Cellulomonas pakistanensis TaxID=992287 RepID=A0A919U6C5_9CELL|nr:prepilin-type N-terminal cleavage/methylation domain-containing protein [Cellulomonas pakistanensis]GIG36864.1 hypothetical protein Cpa01nite_22450 [Cellulomonas pakistanensis]
MTRGTRLARWRRSRDAGFTLVESVVATTLFGIFAASLLTFVMGTFRMTVETQRRVTASQLAAGSVAEARALAARPPAGAAGPAAVPIDPTFLVDTSTVDVGGVPYEVRRTATVVRPEGGPVCGDPLSAVATPAALAEVRVEVSWPTARSPVRVEQREPLTERSFVAVRVHDDQQPVAGLEVALLSAVSAGAPPGLAGTATTGTDGCAVFEVDPAADPAPSHWYAVDTGDATAASAQYVTADWRFSTGTVPLGRVGPGEVRSAAVEVRREATLRFVLLDGARNPLAGSDTDGVSVSLVAADGRAHDAEQVRSTAEAVDVVVPDDRSRTAWRYPARHRDLAADGLWWTAGGAPVVTPSSVTITLHPVDQEVQGTEPAVFEIAATGDGPLHVLWQVSGDGGYTWHDLDSGEEMTSVQVPPGTELPGGITDRGVLSVRAVVSNGVGHAVSATARVRVLPAEEEEPAPQPALPVITMSPVDATASVGDRVTFEASAEGAPAQYVLWQSSSDSGLTWDDLAVDADLWTWETPELTAQDHARWYRAVVIGAEGIAISGVATVSLFEGPREFTLRALWPADYVVWVGPRPGALVPVTLEPGRTVDLLLSVDGGVVAVRDADGVVTVVDGGAG